MSAPGSRRYPALRQAARLHLWQQLAERFVVHLASVLLTVDHETRSRVDLPFVPVGLLLLEDPVPQVGVGECLVERRPRSCRPAPPSCQISSVLLALRAKAQRSWVASSAVMNGLVRARRQRARHHGGAQRDLVQREVVPDVADLPGSISSFFTRGKVSRVEGGAVGAGQARRYSAPSPSRGLAERRSAMRGSLPPGRRSAGRARAGAMRPRSPAAGLRAAWRRHGGARGFSAPGYRDRVGGIAAGAPRPSAAPAPQRSSRRGQGGDAGHLRPAAGRPRRAVRRTGAGLQVLHESQRASTTGGRDGR